MAKHTVASLQAFGFDEAYKLGESGALIAKCSQCEALVINGTPTHERTCPNAMRECEGCNTIIPSCGRFCIDCIE